jgi:uncharacterized protein (DUF488 family)
VRHNFYTIGHSTRTIAEFVDLLRQGRVGIVVDIRTVPRSRTNPQYNLDALGHALAEYQIGHTRIAALGGLRGRSCEVPPEVNGYWQNKSFHNYADYAMSAEFRDGIAELLALGERQSCAVMCSEAVWWRCHRRFIADHLLLRGEQVFHLMWPSRVEPARMNEAARDEGDGVIVYPASSP